MLPDDVPTEITKLTYADHRDLVRAGMPVLSQNQTAAVLAAYWPAIEKHIRAQMAGEFAAALLAVDPVEWALAGQHAGADAARLIRRMSGAPSAGHVCGNCDGVDPESCLTNPERAVTPTSKEQQR